MIIATYNERENMQNLIPSIFQYVPNANLLIVDDNSPDGTANVIENLKGTFPGLHLLKRAGKLGYGTAFVDGFAYAFERGAERIITMDADFSHDPAEIPHMLETSADTDVVVGSRYFHGVRILNWPLRRLLLSAFANRYVNLILRMHLKDCTSGFRCYKAEALKAIDFRHIKSRGYSFLVELLFRIKRKGFTIKEYPIVYTERREGQSKMSKSLIIESFFRPLLLRLDTLFKK